uniref:Mediator of RNA polymerase II transcription subunit 18 n=1 Tax=Macrostomum lignano TaxID=282301 RepID=A0A1I8FGE6_9PLAT
PSPERPSPLSSWLSSPFSPARGSAPNWPWIPKQVGPASRHRPGFHLCCQAPFGGFHLWRLAAASSSQACSAAKYTLEVTGPRLNRRREDWQSVVYAPDRRLELQVRRLSMKVHELLASVAPATGPPVGSKQLANFILRI